MKVALFAISFLFCSLVARSQQIVSHYVPFESGLQNMWGPSFNAFSINRVDTLFHVQWNETFGTGNGGIVNIAGAQFGAAMNGNFSGTIGSKFALQGFTTGELSVDYPIDVTLDMDPDLTYDQGDLVSIDTDYEVDNQNYALQTWYPSAGEATLDLYFGFGAGLEATVCAFGCATFDIIPSFNTGIQNINIFTINTSEISFFSFNNSAPLYSYSVFPLTTDLIPNDPLGNFGLYGELDLPYVETTDDLLGQDLQACGDYQYLTLALDIFALLGNIPGPVGLVLGNLSGSQEIGGFGAEVYWNFFSASFEVGITNNQCFDFTPTVFGEFEFPVPVDYQIYDPATGTTSVMDTSSLIEVELGQELQFNYPCYFEELDITPTYSIDGQITNHTYDEISFDFLMSAFAFGLTIPEIEITPEIHVPEICINIPYPCPTWSNPFKWCSERVCTPAFTIPAIVSPEINLGFGPLWETSIPLGSISYDWFNQTWSLEGFSEYTFPSFKMIASPLEISNVKTDILCYGDSTGAIDITMNAISPALPYTYTWTNGEVIEDLTDLPAGPYEVSVYDDNGCQMFTGATIVEPDQPLLVQGTAADKSCNGGVDDGEIDLFVQGGTPPYSFTWSNGATSEDLIGLAAGMYDVVVSDDNGCEETLSVEVFEPNVLGQVGIATPINCQGGWDGVIETDAFGGTLPFTYSWNSGQSTQDIDSIQAGIYTLTITDAKGCTSTEDYAVTEPATAVQLALTGVDILCKEDSTGSIDLTVNGGTPSYAYMWSNSNGLVLPFQTEDITQIPADTYTVIVTDENGCQETDQITLTEPVESIQSSEVLNHIDCNGDATGVIDPQISGGTPPYTYAWSNGATSAVNNNITAGLYSLTVTDNAGCQAIFEYTLNEPTALDLQSSKVDVLCHGDNTGEAAVVVSGGTPGYSYVWSNGALTSEILGLAAGGYTLVVTDAVGCIINGAVTIDQPANPLSEVNNVTDVLCYGDSTGAIELIPSGGTAPYTYVWSNSGSIVLADTTTNVEDLPADVYQLTIEDANNCTYYTTIEVEEPAAPLEIVGSVVDVTCLGDNNGSIDVTVSGGSVPYTFAWSNGAVTEDATNLLAGSYTIDVVDGHGCVQSASYTVTEPLEQLVAGLEVVDVNCLGGSDGSMTSEVSGGTPPYTYAWSNGATTPNIYNLGVGPYSVTVTDANGCIAFTGGVVREPATEVGMTFTTLDISCFGGFDGAITIVPEGGTEPYSYDWGDQGEQLFSAETETISGLTVGDYFIRVVDANGCVHEQLITVNEPTLLESSHDWIDVLCKGDATGSIDVTTTGATPPYTYNWDNGATTEDISGLIAGQYIYEITDDNGCTLSDSVIISQPTSLWSRGDVTEITCEDQTDGSIIVEVDGGNPPYIFEWNTGSDEKYITNLGPGDYWVIFTDRNNCSDTLDFTLDASNEDCLYVPNTFTPNGDNYNDTWIIENIELYPNAMVKVFNKWGNEVFSHTGIYEPWDGTVNGAPLPSEVYYYIIELNNADGLKYNGVVTIVR